MKHLFAILLLAASLQLSAQDDPYQINMAYDGYIIHNDGTEERGFIRYLNEEKRHEMVLFSNEKMGKTKKYKIGDISGYMVAEKKYRAVEYDDVIGRSRKFLVVLDEGCINTYTFSELGSDGTWSTISVFENEDGAISSQKFALKFAKNMAELVKRNEELARKVADKENGYGMLKMYDIVEEYNANCKQ